MIWLYTGTPGSGKSLHVAKDIYTKLLKEDWVFANFEINLDYFIPKKRRNPKNTMKGVFIERDNFKLNSKWFMDFAQSYFKRDKKGRIKEGQALLVIDECQLMFNSRDWNNTGRYEWISFFTQHRKFGYNILLVTQYDRLIDRQMRSLVEYEVKHRKLSNFKMFGKIVAFVMGGNAFMSITYWYGVKEKISAELFSGKKYYNFYDSYRIFDTKIKSTLKS
jgi:zona occludens toxin (predicted ATPase)